MRKIFWTAYSFVTGFAADVLALAASAAVSVDVRAAPRGIVIAALVMEVPLVVFGETVSSLGARSERAATEESKGGYALLSLAFLCLTLAWSAVGLAFADLVTKDFDVNGFWPYVGTLALVAAAGVAIYLPLHVRRRMAR